MTYFDRQYDLLVDNLWSLINVSFKGDNETKTQESFLGLIPSNDLPGLVQIIDTPINNTLPVFEQTDVSSVNATMSNNTITYSLKLTNTNGYIVIGIANVSNNSNNSINVDVDSLKNGTDVDGKDLVQFTRQYCIQGLSYDFPFDNLTQGQSYNIYFAAGSDTFKTEQLWTILYTHTRTTGILRLILKITALIGWGILLLMLY